MSEEEVTKEVSKLGYQLEGSGPSGSGEVANHYYNESENTMLAFFFSTENKLNHKFIHFNGKSDDGNKINDLLEKYRENYLKLVGIDFEEYGSEPNEDLGAIFFRNEKYAGQVQVRIIEGVVSVTYGLKEGHYN